MGVTRGLLPVVIHTCSPLTAFVILGTVRGTAEVPAGPVKAQSARVTDHERGSQSKLSARKSGLLRNGSPNSD